MHEIDELKFDIALKDVMNEESKITTIKSLENFIANELVFWRDEVQKNFRFETVNQIVTQLNTCKAELENFKTSYPSLNEQQKSQKFKGLLSSIPNHLKTVAFANTPFAKSFVEVCQIGSQQAQSFWGFVAKQGNGQLPGSQWGYLEGLILGYEYLHQDENQLTKRRDSEKKALSALRNSLKEKTDEIIRKADDFIRQVDEWKETTKQELAGDRESYKSEQQEFLSSAETKLTDQLVQDEENRSNFFKQAQNRMDELETLYREKLRLEPAAQYWRDRARDLKNAGRGLGATMAVTTLAIGVGFGWLFLQWMMSGKIIEKFTAMHWQGVVLLLAAVSMAIFLVRVLGKLTFSSFHLQRDAEERELLSYLYLALSKDGNVNVESRQVVLQSLFSRAETGLLSGDHGPTIPVAEVVQKLKSS